MTLNLKVQLPSGEVNVPVQHNSTPGHLKENLKYSLRAPPKCFKLFVDGRELDDMKPMAGEPNNVTDDCIVTPVVDELALSQLDQEPMEKASKPVQPTRIVKEEPPKPKKPKKDKEIRPILGPNDVQKGNILAPGLANWAINKKWLEGKSPNRQMVFLKIEATVENKSYPEQEDGTVALALGDPQVSPAWIEVAEALEIGERAEFVINAKVLDFDPEGLAPTDSTSKWVVELVEVTEVKDILEDFSQLLHVEDVGSSARVEDLDRVAVHWRVRRWMAEGAFCIASSRERIAILPGYGLVPIEDQSAPPVPLSVGEGQQEAAEIVVRNCGPGGKGHLYLKSNQLKSNRPQGTVIMDVEFVAIDPNRGPGTPGWKGWQSLVQEIEQGSEWLMQSDERRKQLETFGTLRKSTNDSAEAEDHVAGQVHKYAENAARRFARALKWIDVEGQAGKKEKTQKANLQMKLAKANSLSYMRFGENPPPASEAEKKALSDSLSLLSDVKATSEAMGNEQLSVDCLKMSLQVLIQAENTDEAKVALEQLQVLRPGDDDLRDDAARLHRLDQALMLKKGASTIETMQKDLQAGNEVKDKAAILPILEKLFELMKNNEVKYAAITKLKLGKDVGNAMKLGDQELAQAGRKIVGEIQRLAQQNALGL